MRNPDFWSRLKWGQDNELRVAQAFSLAGLCVLIGPQSGDDRCYPVSVDLLVRHGDKHRFGEWQPVEVKTGPRLRNGTVLVAAERSFRNHGGTDSLYAHWAFIDQSGAIMTLPKGCPVSYGESVTDRARNYTYKVVTCESRHLRDFQTLCNRIQAG